MRMFSFSAVAALCTFAAPTFTSAQTSPKAEFMAIDAAVASYLGPKLPKSGVVFEARIRTAHGWGAQRSPARLSALSALGKSAHRDSIYTCERGLPSSCTLRNARALVALSDPIISGDASAVVHVELLTLSGLPRIPVTRKNTQLRLVKERTGWRVVSSEVTSIT